MRVQYEYMIIIKIIQVYFNQVYITIEENLTFKRKTCDDWSRKWTVQYKSFLLPTFLRLRLDLSLRRVKFILKLR